MIRSRIKEQPLFETLARSRKPIVLYGMGNGADRIIHHLKRYSMKPAGVFASDEFVRGHKFHGHQVLTYQEACREFGSMIVLVAFGTHREDVIAHIEKIASEQELYVPDVEVSGDSLFDRVYMDQNLELLNDVYESLADEASKTTYECLLNYKLSGRLEWLFKAETPVEAIYNDILPVKDGEVFVDGGAYDGDTVRAFVQRAHNYKRIYAVEPDGRSFEKLQKKTMGIQHLHCIKAALGNRDGEMSFNELGGRQSAASKNGSSTVAVKRIDSIAPDASYIKLDVEGYEMSALLGAKATIMANRPRLEVSAYHRNKDMFLPLMVQEMRGDYKVYMRHTRCIPAWDTYYYFV